MGLLSFLKKPERKPGSVCPQPREQEAFLCQIEDVFARQDK